MYWIPTRGVCRAELLCLQANAHLCLFYGQSLYPLGSVPGCSARRTSADLDAAAALIQGAAASAGPSSADLESAAALIQSAASSADPSSADLEAAAALIQGAAPSVLGPSSADLEAAAALIQGAAASVGISVLGPTAAP